MPGARRGALPLAVFIVALLAAGISVAVVRGGDDTPKADESPTPTFTITTASPTPTGTVTTTPPTESPTETVSPTTASPTDTASPTETTMSPTSTILPTTPTIVPTTTGTDMPRTGVPVGGWLIGGLILMFASSALMRALTRGAAA